MQLEALVGFSEGWVTGALVMSLFVFCFRALFTYEGSNDIRVAGTGGEQQSNEEVDGLQEHQELEGWQGEL